MQQSDLRILTGDCRDLLPTLPAAAFDAVLTDPPYELGLMRFAWDATAVAHDVRMWSECLRVLKPGGHLLAFGSPRTYHRMACAIEDSGFEIRDSIHWIYGNGFPKGADVSKAIDRRRTDRSEILKVTTFLRSMRDLRGLTDAEIDAHFGTQAMARHWMSVGSQPSLPTPKQWTRLKLILGFGDEMDAEVARLRARMKQPSDNWTARTVSGLYHKPAPGNEWKSKYDGELPRIGNERRDQPATEAARTWHGWGTTLKPAHEPIVLARKPFAGGTAANVLKFRTGALNLNACRIGGTRDGEAIANRLPTNVILDEDAAKELDLRVGSRSSHKRRPDVPRRNRGGYSGPTTATPSRICYADHGGASRFFYVPKASQAERRAGLSEGTVRHPTIKPVALMRHLVRLVTPPGGTVLDPFAGSGTTGIAAVLEGAKFVGIERESEYAAMAEARIAHWKGGTDEQRAA